LKKEASSNTIVILESPTKARKADNSMPLVVDKRRQKSVSPILGHCSETYSSQEDEDFISEK
jgi:hypothetical protein